MRHFTPPWLHLLGPKLPMGMSLLYYVSQNGYTIRNMLEKAKNAVKLNSKDRNRLKMAFVSPQIVKYSSIQLHFLDAPNGYLRFHEEKVAK